MSKVLLFSPLDGCRIMKEAESCSLYSKPNVLRVPLVLACWDDGAQPDAKELFCANELCPGCMAGIWFSIILYFPPVPTAPIPMFT